MQRFSALLLAVATLSACAQGSDEALNATTSTTTDLSNGAVLDIHLSDDPFFTSFPVVAGSHVPIVGNASVGVGAPDIAYIYILDTSGSTDKPDGDCGTVLDCIQAFMLALHKEAVTNGSAELAAVINFDTEVQMSTDLVHPSNNMKTIEDAVQGGVSVGDTNCAKALEAATKLVLDPSNTAGTTVVVFAGDGYCTDFDDDDVRAAADALGATGAIVHTVAVGDNVDCDMAVSDDFYALSNNLLDIPQNGGNCTSVPDPDTLPAIIDDLIGTTLVSIEVQFDDGNYTELPHGIVSERLPEEGAISVEFNTSIAWSKPGLHKTCVRATGEDSLGGWSQVEDCQEILIVIPEEEFVASGFAKLGGGMIALIVISSLVGVAALLVSATQFVRCMSSSKKEDITPEQLAADAKADSVPDMA